MRKLTLISLVALMIISITSTGLAEDDYPTRGIEIVVGWGAGGGTDTMARSIATPARGQLEENLNIVNKPGSNGLEGASYVQNQPADGYTVWAMGSNYPINVALGRTEYDLDEWEPVIRVQHDIGVIATAADGEYDSIDDLVEEANNNPGEVKIGGAGAQGFDEVATREFIQESAPGKINYVSYQETGKQRKDVMAGEIDAIFAEPQEINSLLDSEDLKLLLVLKEGDRLDEFPDTPTSGEKGWSANQGIFRGFLVKKGTSQERIDFLHDLIKDAMEDGKYKAIEKQSFLHLREGYLGPEEFGSFLDDSVNTFEELLGQ